MKALSSHSFYVPPANAEESWFRKRQRLLLTRRREPVSDKVRRQLFLWSEFPRQAMALSFQDSLPLADSHTFAVELDVG